MIAWLLERLVQHPGASFSRAELQERFPVDWPRALRDGLLQPRPLDLEGTYLDPRTGREYALRERDGALEGWDLDQPGSLPVTLRLQDLTAYCVDLGTLCRQLQQVYSLAGQTIPLQPRLHLLGTCEPVGTDPVAVVLALFPTPRAALPHLHALPSTLPGAITRAAILFPNGWLGGGDRELLRARGWLPVELGGADPARVDLTDLLQGWRAAAGKPTDPEQDTCTLARHTVATLCQRCASLQQPGRRVKRAEMAAELGVNEATLGRHLQHLRVRWRQIATAA